MLDPDAIDLSELCVALADHSPEVSWWIDPRTGQIRPHMSDVDGEDAPGVDDWTRVEPVQSHQRHRDMADFVELVPDHRAADALGRAIAGRRAFRGFTEILLEYPELREQWFRFRDARARRRAVEWLAGEGLISVEAAERAAGARPDRPLVVDPVAVAVAADLAELYGARLHQVLVFGSRARGDATEESDLDLVVVLADMTSPWKERRRMDEVLWRHTERSGMTVTAVPVSIEQWRAPRIPFLIRAAAEAVSVA